MSIVLDIALITALAALPQSEEGGAYSLSSARNLKIAGERPTVIVIAEAGDGETRRGTAIAASVRMEVSSDGTTITPVWSAMRVNWTGDRVASSNVISQTDCPGLSSGLVALGSLGTIRPALPVEPRPVAAGTVPPPDIRLHQSFTIWSRSAAGREDIPDSAVEYSAVGGPITEIAEAFIRQTTSCWADR